MSSPVVRASGYWLAWGRMSTRLDIELTSRREEGEWTWRVAGARQPKGTVPAGLVPEGARVGDVLSVEAEVDLDGIFIRSVIPPRQQRSEEERDGTRRIEVIGSARRDSPGVTAVLRSRTGARPDTQPARSRQMRDPHALRRKRSGDLTGPNRSRKAELSDASRDRPARVKRRAGDAAGNRHRQAFLDSLPPEQRTIAERLVRGGLAAVRRTIAVQNESARQAGHPEVPEGPVLAIAESLAPRLKAAAWCDRAEAVLESGEATTLSELRALVSSAEEAGRDEPGRSLLERLRAVVASRVAESRSRWEEQVVAHLEAGEVARALKLSARPPDPGARLSSDLAGRLAEAASQGLSAEAPPPRWAILLEAAASSPVRVNVRPSGIPADAPEELLSRARQLAGRIPAVAKLLGLAIPPPPTRGG
jgi:hypothetical protein